MEWIDDTTSKLKIQCSDESKATKGYLRAYVKDTDSDTKLAYTDIYVSFNPAADSLPHPAYNIEPESQKPTIDPNQEMLRSESDNS